MMLQSGSVFNSVRIAKLTAEWEQKYSKLQKHKKEKMSPDEMITESTIVKTYVVVASHFFCQRWLIILYLNRFRI